MQLLKKNKIEYIKINNFKIINLNDAIFFSDSSIIIGPNNSGKTSVLQAIVLWQKCFKEWLKSKEENILENNKATINRLNLTSSLIKKANLLWNNSNTLQNIEITAGLFFNNEIKECSIILEYANSEIFYVYPSKKTIAEDGLIEFITQLNIKIFYPLTQLFDEEPIYNFAYILSQIESAYLNNVFINMCLELSKNQNSWNAINEIMKLMFNIQLNLPKTLSSIGKVTLDYIMLDSGKHFPISMSGTGQQQLLALLVFFGFQHNSILLFDEPDAHLESLRQSQVFNLLKHLNNDNNNQLIISTHSEVIINDSADFDINLMLNGTNTKLTGNNTTNKLIQFFIKEFGMEHYYKAKHKQSVLYVEGKTDILMLLAFAKKLNHQAKNILESDLYSFYVLDNYYDENIESILDSPNSKIRKKYEKHFQGIQSVIPNFKAIGIFDNDNNLKTDTITTDKAIVYWKKYELENYFVSIENIEKFIKFEFNNFDLLKLKNAFDFAINKTNSDFLFSNQKDLSNYNNLPDTNKSFVFGLAIENKKGSNYLDLFFKEFSNQLNIKTINKGDYYKIIDFMEIKEINQDIIDKLDLITKYL